MLVLFLGAFWASSTLQELSDEKDFRELRAIMVVQSIIAVMGGVASFLWYWYVGQLLSFGGMAMLYFIGWLYDLSYELFASSRKGLACGPAVPFVSDESIVRLRRFLRIPA
jgi:hypothetical protein